jgi:hypothetical protein
MTRILKYNVFIEHTTKYAMGIIFSYGTQNELSENPNKNIPQPQTTKIKHMKLIYTQQHNFTSYGKNMAATGHPRQGHEIF